jgi:hypothetical protein
MPDANYAVSGMGQEVAGPSFVVCYISRTTVPSTTGVRISSINSNGQNDANSAYILITVTGN